MGDLLFWCTIINILISTSFDLYTNLYSRPTAEKINNLGAVSRFEGIETYYRRLKSRGRGLPPEEPSEEKDKIFVRKAVCKNILKSYYFEMRGEEYLDIDNANVRNELRNDYPLLFYEIYRERRNQTPRLFQGDGFEYVNDYKVKSVRVLGINEDEYVITCPARGTHSRRIKAYFVTKLYNVNPVAMSFPVYGRFIFARRSNNDLGLIAMAEESAYQWELLRKIKVVHLLYMMRTDSEREIARVPLEDPVCGLSAAHKLRLCTSMFASPMFRKQGFKFTPTLRSVRQNCVKKQVLLLEPIFSGVPLLERVERIIRSRFRPREEWTIGCQASTAKGDRIVFYVSSVGSDHEIFAYTKSSVLGHVNLFSAFMNISVVPRWQRPVGEPERTFTYQDVED